MSERDCGKWYCQNPAGFRRLIYGEDILLFQGTRAYDDDRAGLDAERRSITGHSHPVKGWMGDHRAAGFNGWLAAYTHGNGAAQRYWIWDPDSRGKYMEAYGPFRKDEVPSDFGELHRGRGWQLPMVAIFLEEPSSTDIYELKEVKVPYVVLPDEDDDGGDDDTPPPPPSDCVKGWGIGTSRRDLHKKVDYVICLLEG